MTDSEIYNALRLFVRSYIQEQRQAELLQILDQREAEKSFPPGKGILADMHAYPNGQALKPEHKELYEDVCWHCV
jgi:hypothetical protein